MSYHPTALSGGVVDVALAAKSVVEDPCLYDTAQALLRLNQLEQGSGSSSTSTTTVKGIGLCKALPIVRKVVWVRERPATAVLIGLGIVGGIFAAGYLVAKRGRR